MDVARKNKWARKNHHANALAKRRGKRLLIELCTPKALGVSVDFMVNTQFQFGLQVLNDTLSVDAALVFRGVTIADKTAVPKWHCDSTRDPASWRHYSTGDALTVSKIEPVSHNC